MGKEKVGMTLFFNWERPLSRVPAEDFKTIVMGVMAFEARGEALPSPESFENELSGMAADFIFPLVERGWEKSKECSEAGKKGMNSRWHSAKAEDSENEEVSEVICEGDNGVICEGDNEVIREADNGVIRREDNNRKEKNINRTEIETDKGTKRISETPPSNSPKGEGARAPARAHAHDKPEKVKYAETVSMSAQEYQSLVDKYGEPLTQKMIEKLDNYKASNGKKYKDDYKAILNWVAEEVEKKYPNLIRRSAPSFDVNPFAEYLEDDEKPANPSTGSSFDRDEFFEAAVAASMDRHRKACS